MKKKMQLKMEQRSCTAVQGLYVSRFLVVHGKDAVGELHNASVLLEMELACCDVGEARQQRCAVLRLDCMYVCVFLFANDLVPTEPFFSSSLLSLLDGSRRGVALSMLFAYAFFSLLFCSSRRRPLSNQCRKIDMQTTTP